jgi:hypothetical protein
MADYEKAVGCGANATPILLLAGTHRHTDDVDSLQAL